MKKYALIVLLALGAVGQTLPKSCNVCSTCDSKTCCKPVQKSIIPPMAKMITAAGIGGALMRVVDGDASKLAVIKWTMGWSMLCGLYTWAKFAANKREYGNNHPGFLTCMTTSFASCVAGNRAPEIIDAAKSLGA